MIWMRISTIPRNAGSNLPSWAGRGFSLLEILVALFLGAIILGLALGINFDSSSRKQLEETMDWVERGIRFGVDEAILRNRIVRLRFLLGEEPQQFTLEYAPDETFILSKKVLDLDNEDDLDREEREEQREFLEEFGNQFQPVAEFQEEGRALPESVRIFWGGNEFFGATNCRAGGFFVYLPYGGKGWCFDSVGYGGGDGDAED